MLTLIHNVTLSTMFTFPSKCLILAIMYELLFVPVQASRAILAYLTTGGSTANVADSTVSSGVPGVPLGSGGSTCSSLSHAQHVNGTGVGGSVSSAFNTSANFSSNAASSSSSTQSHQG